MSQSTASRLMLADNSAMDSNPLYISAREIAVGGERMFGREDGHRGTRQRHKCRARVLSDKSGGSFSGYFSPAEIDWLIPRAIGDTGSSPWYPGESIAAIYVLVDKVAAIYQSTQRINFLEISGQETQYLNWTVGLVGGAEAAYGSSWPASPTPDCDTAFTFSDITFTYSGTAYKLQSFRLRIDNAIDDQQYENAITPTRFESQDLIITMEAQCAFRSDTTALYRAAIAGAAASLAISDGTTTYTIAFANLKIPNGSPTIPATGRINMPLSMEAFRNSGSSDSDNQISFTKS